MSKLIKLNVIGINLLNIDILLNEWFNISIISVLCNAMKIEEKIFLSLIKFIEEKTNNTKLTEKDVSVFRHYKYILRGLHIHLPLYISNVDTKLTLKIIEGQISLSTCNPNYIISVILWDVDKFRPECSDLDFLIKLEELLKNYVREFTESSEYKVCDNDKDFLKKISYLY